jgi:hypothetical protein
VATLYEQTDAIDADAFLAPSEKARQKASIKAVGIRDAILAAWTFPKTFSFSRNGHAFVVTISAVSVSTHVAGDGLSRDTLVINGAVTRDGVLLKHPDGTPIFPIVIYNPPCLIAGGGTVSRNGSLFTYDLAALAQGLFSDVVAGVA